MKRWSVMLPLAAVLALAALTLSGRPSKTTAGMLPCFLCHGLQFQGSDLAPSVADTRLTDEEIIQQIRSPRGIMPAFPEFANQSIVDGIRLMPTGQPTAVLPREDRSAALATLAAVAATRATEFSRVSRQEADSNPSPSPTPLPPTSTPGPATAAVAPSPSATSLAGPSTSPARVNGFAAVGGLLAVIGGVWWLRQRRGQ